MGPYEKKPPFSVGCASRVGSEGFSERAGDIAARKLLPAYNTLSSGRASQAA